MIYFIQAKTPDRPGPIKIGYTAKAKIWERVNELQKALMSPTKEVARWVCQESDGRYEL